MVRSDNGVEYTSEKFEKFCEEFGVHHQLSNVYTLHQNRVSERKNRIVMNMARCLLFESKLPNYFWAEVVNIVVYLLNRQPTKVVERKTPFEAWYGFKPFISHLRVFGCPCFVHVSEDKISKLDSRSQLEVLFGYSSAKEGYRIYNPFTSKVIISKDVKFDERRIWNWTATEEEMGLKLDVRATEDQTENDPLDEQSVRGTRCIIEIYQREEAEWRLAMKDEITMIKKNETWELVDRPVCNKLIGVKWVFRTKMNPNGSVNKYKLRFFAKGFCQQYGVDFTETFALVASLGNRRLLITFAAQKGWIILQIDVKSAFLNGILKEEIYVEQPQGFIVPEYEANVYKLYKALYSLKQAPKARYERIYSHLIEIGFERSISKPVLYVKKTGNEILFIISLYVDDLLMIGSNNELVILFKYQMQEKFEMSGLGEMTYFLDLKINQAHDVIFINQKGFAINFL
ncbi:Retrovirus-related Pol polyprotein from transposon TNT 1-94 [Gossypium australe]|uniref:Retrovirus-related Pol polyprotein from transposon TNT 1-94 n=1 Tax=Gossypium australe TaxID=47621 RepID=A0A5B6WF92_9ROSI|nr:Retrovirus-related Pol polyprotein from transposon TNT 1-94 [Gossypium australe]